MVKNLTAVGMIALAMSSLLAFEADFAAVPLRGEAKCVETLLGAGLAAPGKADSYASLPVGEAVKGGAMTTTTWVKLNRLPEVGRDRNGVFGLSEGCGGRFVIGSGESGLSLTCQLDLHDTAGTSRTFVGHGRLPRTFSAGDWFHLAIVYSLARNRLELYLDGTLVAVRQKDTKGKADLTPLVMEASARALVGAMPPMAADATFARFRVVPEEYDAARIAAEESASVKAIFADLKARHRRLKLSDAEPSIFSVAAAQLAARRHSADQAIFKDGDIALGAVKPFEGGVYGLDSVFPPEAAQRPIEAAIAQGEYTSAAFLVRSRKPVKGFKPTISFSDPLPASVADFRILKPMYRPSINSRRLIPTMLVHDDAVLKLDFEKQEHLARYSFPDRTEYRPLCYTNMEWHALWPVSAAEHPIRDADDLQPIDLAAGVTREYFIRFRIPEGTEPGVYQGEISAAGAKLPVRLRVLPFALPKPKTRYDLTQDYTAALYFRFSKPDYRPGAAGTISPTGMNEEQFRRMLRDVKEHGVCHVGTVMHFPLPRWDWDKKGGAGIIWPTDADRASFRKTVAIMTDEGVVTKPFYIHDGGNLGFREHYSRKEHKEALEKVWNGVREMVREAVGHADIVAYGVDEAEGERLRNEYAFWEDLHEMGGKTFVSGLSTDVTNIARRIAIMIASSAPEKKTADAAHALGSKIWNYGWPQIENIMDPYEYRRNYGYGCWATDYDGFDFYAYVECFDHPWNPFDSRLGWDGMLVYPTVNSLIPTPAWEAIRDGVNDVRYLTLLGERIAAADKGSDTAMLALAKEAKAFLMSLDPKVNGFSPSDKRMEVVRWILKLN